MAAKIVTVVIACVINSAVCGFSVEIPQECEDQNFCGIKPANFPQSEFDEYVRENQLFQSNRFEGEPMEVIHDSDIHNCHTKVSIFQPYLVKSNTTMKLIVQSNSFQQWIKQTECLSHGASCFENVMKPFLSSACTPTYGTIKMYLYDPQTKKYNHEPVSFPICCSCSIKSKI